MDTVITWAADGRSRRARCRACCREVDATSLGWVTALGIRDLELVRCDDCLSIDLLDAPRESSPTDESVDAYIEGGAGIGTIAAGLSRVDPASVVNVLDVGCGYGFALDIGRFLYGWAPIGIEPSRAGVRGALELELDIRNDYLTASTDLGRRFDLVHSSEVIEHVPDPLSFLRALREHVTDDGCVVLTTPAAEIVAESSAASDVLTAVSAGFHVFLASAAGLERLLRSAGFASVDVTRHHGTLHAIASVAPNRAFEPGGLGRDVERTLEPYYRFRDKGAPADSALANGMITRYVRAVVSRGDFDAAMAASPRLIDCMRQRHGLDLTNPESVLDALAAGTPPPWHLAGAAFALGMVELLHRRRRDRAATYFELTGEAVAGFEKVAGVLDLDSVDLRAQGALHHALALAVDDANRASAMAAAMGSDPSTPGARLFTCRIFVELVAAGQYEAAAQLEDMVAASIRDLVERETEHDRVISLDSLFSLGILALNTGHPAAAHEWFQRCLHVADVAEDAHSLEVAEWARAHIALTVEHGAPTDVRVERWRRPPTIHHSVDVYWCDPYGTFVEGWAWAEGERVERFTLRVGDAVCEAVPGDSAHLLQYWPDDPACARAGFTAYAEGRPAGRTVLTLHTTVGDRDVELELPSSPLPAPAVLADVDPAEMMKRWIASAPPGPVLALGVRAANTDIAARRREMFGDRDVVGLDIHPGAGVDVVGDAHVLSRFLPKAHFAVVFSTSLLEHVAVPWLVAAECAAVLRPGGLAVHGAPWVWPTHGEPNDFWRFSTGGLQQLFGPATGFRVLDGGSCASAVVVPSPIWRRGAAKMPTTSSAALSWVVSERLADPPPAVAWAYDPAVGADEARRYPVDGLASEDIDATLGRTGAAMEEPA